MNVVLYIDDHLQVISVVSKNQECVNDISASEVLAYLLLVLQTLPSSTYSRAVRIHHFVAWVDLK